MNLKDTPRFQQFHQAHRIFRMANRWIYTHSIIWMEYSLLCSLFILLKNSLKCVSQKRESCAIEKLGHVWFRFIGFGVHLGRIRLLTVVSSTFWDNFGCLSFIEIIFSWFPPFTIYTLLWPRTMLNDYFICYYNLLYLSYFISSYSVFATKV